MPWGDRIVADPAILAGKPLIKRTSLAVEFVIELMAEGWTREQIEENDPSLTEDHLRAVLHDAVEYLWIPEVPANM